MDFEQEQSVQSNMSAETQTVSNTEQQTKLNNLPTAEEMLKSETQIKTNIASKEISTSPEPAVKDRVFARKEDERNALIKKRLKIVGSVYLGVVALLVAFVLTNVFTLVSLKKQITTNTTTITDQVEKIENAKLEPGLNPETPVLEISLNEPRDYTDEKKELTFLDKLTILFRNLFG